MLGMGHIAIDGKSLCGSSGSKWGPLHVVSAWATQANLTLGQVAVDSKSNEITAIPPLLELLDLRGALVTIDAMGCQKENCQSDRQPWRGLLAGRERQPGALVARCPGHGGTCLER